MKAVMAPDLHPWRVLARADFDELPGMRLTPTQAQRLWNVDAGICWRVLETLVDERFLVRVGDGSYCRADRLDGAYSID